MNKMNSQNKLVEYLTKEIDECRNELKKAEFCHKAGFRVESQFISDTTWPRFRALQDIDSIVREMIKEQMNQG